VKKSISILFSVVMIISSAQLTIARHYCGGEFAARKISLSGELATCGMEGSQNNCSSTGNRLTTHCCDNKVFTIAIVNIFTTPVSIQKVNLQNILYQLSLPVNNSFQYITEINYSFLNISPPGEFSASAVDLDNICAYRI